MNQNWLLLIPVVALVLFVIGPITVLRLQKKSLRVGSELSPGPVPRAATVAGFQQSSEETREEFVRRHWQRPGVVADGVTLVDLYDRIRVLEERLARAEQQSASPPLD